MQAKRRLALVTAFPPGKQSLNEYGFHLARELAARPDVDEVVVLADKLDTPMQELDNGPKITVRRCWRFNSPMAAINILTALHKCEADGVIWNLQTATFGDREIPAALGMFGPALARMSGIRSGVIAHNLISGIDLESTQLRGQHLRQAIIRVGGAVVTRALLSANYMTVTLRSYLDRLEEQYPKANVVLVPHGTFDTLVRDLTQLHDRPKRIVTMGKFGTYKRLETLIEAFAMLREDPEFSDYELVIGGTDHPNAKGYLDSVAQRHADDPAIIFHGYVAEDDIPAFFGEARASVFDYSSTTGSSGVLHQTASYGTVPVFPDIGDFVDVSRDEGLTGRNYAVNSAPDMCEALRRALGDLATSQVIADANRRAAADIPLCEIADFHVEALRTKRADKPLQFAMG